MQKLTRFFWLCAGANTTLLKQCPSDASKYAGIGATIFFTGIFAALAAGYALFTVTENIGWSILFGILWGLMIFNLDRYIVSSMRKEDKAGKELLHATPRLILAVLISLVIAKPLEMKIFQHEINGELAVMEQQLRSRQEGEISQRYAQTRTTLTTQIADLKAEIQRKASIRDQLREIARQEADGTGGTGKRNPGPVYKIKKQDADKAEEELKALQQTNGALIVQTQDQLQALDSAQRLEMSTLEHQKMSGPAAGMEALSRLSKQSEAIYWANIFIILLFIAVETAPIFVKLISARGPYDEMLKTEEHSYTARRIEMLANTNNAVKKRSAGLNDTEAQYVNEKLDIELGKL